MVLTSLRIKAVRSTRFYMMLFHSTFFIFTGYNWFFYDGFYCQLRFDYFLGSNPCKLVWSASVLPAKRAHFEPTKPFALISTIGFTAADRGLVHYKHALIVYLASFFPFPLLGSSREAKRPCNHTQTRTILSFDLQYPTSGSCWSRGFCRDGCCRWYHRMKERQGYYC